MTNTARKLEQARPTIRLITMSQNENDQTLAPTTEREAETSPHASEGPVELTNPNPPAARPALSPPPPEDLSASQLANRDPPAWWAGSFIGHALSEFAADADDIRKGRAVQHSQQIEAIAEVGRRQDANHRNLGGVLARIGERVTRIESEQRDQGRAIKQLALADADEKIERLREMRAMKSIVTALTIRMDMYEANGHAPKDLDGVQVLVVEDEILLQRTMRKMLERQGATAVIASTWHDVTDAIAGMRPNFVVLDIRLEAEDGVQIAEWLMAKADLKPHQILLMTGQLDPETDEISSSMGLRVIEKPFGAPELVAAIKESLAAAAATPETPPG